MRRLALLSCLILSGCVTPADKEISAWQKGTQLAAQKCANGDPNYLPPRKEAKAFYYCVEEISQSTIAPNVVYPDLYLLMRANALENIEKYSLGKISKDQLRAEAMRNMAGYISASNHRMGIAQQQQQANSLAWLNYSNQIQSLQNQQQIIDQMNRPIQTNCRNTYGGVNCTTW